MTDKYFIDAVGKALIVIASFFLLYALLPYFLSPLDGGPYRPRNFIESVDIRPQLYAYFGAVALTAILALLSSANWLWFTGPVSIAAPVRLESFFERHVRARLIGISSYLARVPAPSILVCAIVLLALVIGCSFLRHDFGERSGSMLGFSDPHVFWTFANLGEHLARGTLSGDEALNPYGVGVPLLYALLRYIGAPASYATTYDLTWGANVLFLSIWTLSAALIARRARLQPWSGLLVIMTAMIMGPPLLTPKSPWVTIPMISALRYIPFLLLFSFLALMRGRAGAVEYIAAASLAVIGIFFSPDTGLFATLGFACAVLLDRKIDFGVVTRALIWLSLFGVIFVSGAWFVQSFSGYDLIATIHQMFRTAVPEAFNVRLGWDGVTVTIFSLAIFTIIHTGPRFFKGDLPREDRVAFIASGIMLMWGIYLVRRPDSAYWIYDALFLFIAINLAVKMQLAPKIESGNWRLYVGLGIALILSTQGLYRTNAFIRNMLTIQLREAAQPKQYIAGIYGPPGWASAASADVASLNRIEGKLNRPLLAVTGQPYLATIYARPETYVWEIGFSFGTQERIAKFVDEAVRSARPVLIDIPTTKYFFDSYRNMSRGVGEALTAELLKRGYSRVAIEGSDGWIVLLPPA